MIKQNFIDELKRAVKLIKTNIISGLCEHIKDNDLDISPDFNITNEVVEIVGDINIDYNPNYDIDIDENICICTFVLDCDIDFNVKIKGYDGNTASYDEDDIHYTEYVNKNAHVQRNLPVRIKAYYRRNANDQLYIDSYNVYIEPITIECTDYDEDYYRQK